MHSTPPAHSARSDHHDPAPQGRRLDNGWFLWSSRGPAQPFHLLEPTINPSTDHQIWIRRLTRPALVLGSTQGDDTINPQLAAELDIEVCRRRSGGGTVLVDPTTDLWVDLIIPAQSSLWADDLGRSFLWVGRLWADALADIDSSLSPHLTVADHKQHSDQGRVLCFAGVGFGEVLAQGAKLVGLSQRRTRHWARIQGVLCGRWNGSMLARLLVDEDSRQLAVRTVAGLDHGRPLPDRDRLVEALAARLPALP